MSKTSLISVRNLHKSFGSHIILSDISLDINEGESFVVIGGSGTGKSVLIKCILGLLEPDQGDILIQGISVKNMSSKEKKEAYSRFGMLFQGGALFDSMSVADNIAFGLVEGMGMDKKQARTIALEKLESVDLSSDIADIFPAELSGGMQKRVALARAVAGNPHLIFFDEPTTGLDPIVSGTINDLIVRCVKKLGASAMTITHDIPSLRHIGDRVGLLHKGSFVWQGLVSEIDTSDNPYIHQFIKGLAQGPLTQA